LMLLAMLELVLQVLDVLPLVVVLVLPVS